jgi:hypothetical protein
MATWYIFPRFGMLYQEKSGNPAQDGRWQHFEPASAAFFFLKKNFRSSSQKRGRHKGPFLFPTGARVLFHIFFKI